MKWYGKFVARKASTGGPRVSKEVMLNIPVDNAQEAFGILYSQSTTARRGDEWTLNKVAEWQAGEWDYSQWFGYAKSHVIHQTQYSLAYAFSSQLLGGIGVTPTMADTMYQLAVRSNPESNVNAAIDLLVLP